ncbi:MAG: DUF3362 domain-containing protein, partial [Clostridia bacterium]|nr:DUF3362 domain-containing protein [Clostridia bacterium]
HSRYIDLLRKLREMPGIKKVFVRSGIRYDYVLEDTGTDFLDELCRYHISGQLKIAPEHVSPSVIKAMKKVPRSVTVRFIDAYRQKNRELGMKQFLVPYFMSSHPGSGLKEAVELAEFIRDSGLRPEQVQDFYPTPSTIATCMYYTQVDPVTMESVYVPKNPHEKAMQRALIQYRNPENRQLVIEALKKGNREDLIGFGPKCLIRPRRTGSEKSERFSNDNKNIKAKKKKSIRNVHRKKQ